MGVILTLRSVTVSFKPQILIECLSSRPAEGNGLEGVRGNGHRRGIEAIGAQSVQLKQSIPRFYSASLPWIAPDSFP